MAQKNNLHCVEARLNQVLDARLDARRRRIRRGFVYSRLLFVRRSDCRSRIPHDGVPRSQREALGRLKQNDIVPSRTRLQPEQDAVGRGLCIRSSAHRGDVDARSRTRTRMHQAGDLENSNGFSRHYWSTAQHIFKKRGGSQYIPQNQHQ